ncbi:hypothetical protein [Rhodoferax sp.]|uniref:hypothetical protein n=1 Tax=Rhodoferax sp. TaxID=50421 RepID=UPI002627C16E|nr:hypothetical protein [Rhodoferax sp.]MDD2920255.1 hypothetical protein [Rhodoferax sp.]
MNHPSQPELSQACAASGSPRKPYLKPAFRHEPVFETMALACGKISSTQAQCRTNRKTS